MEVGLNPLDNTLEDDLADKQHLELHTRQASGPVFPTLILKHTQILNLLNHVLQFLSVSLPYKHLGTHRRSVHHLFSSDHDVIPGDKQHHSLYGGGCGN